MSSRLANVLTLVFFILGIIGILNHEMWFDELQAWLIARDSSSLADLLMNIKYEGQPGIWHLCLYFISKLTTNPVSMQFFHLTIATLTVYLFVQYSPFNKIQKFLFIFSYYVFYEYSLLSRNYSLGVLFIFLFCIFVINRNYLAGFLNLAILANTNIMGLLVAFSLTATLIFEYSRQGKSTLSKSIYKQEIIFGLPLSISGIGLAVYQILPPPDRQYGQIEQELNRLVSDASSKTIAETVIYQLEKVSRTIALIWKSFVPIPDFLKYQSWNTNIALALPTPFQIGVVLIALCLIIYLLILFSDQPTILFLYVLGIGLMLSFMHLITAARHVRHLGYLFIFTLACLWLFNSFNTLKIKPQKESGEITGLAKNYQSLFLTSILCLQVVAGVFSYVKDLMYPFTVSKSVASFIKANRLDRLTIIGSPDFPIASLSAYLNKPIYDPISKQFGTYVVWNNARTVDDNVKFSEVLVDTIEKKQAQEQQDILLVLNRPGDFSNFDLTIVELRKFSKSIVRFESEYYLYLVKYQGKRSP